MSPYWRLIHRIFVFGERVWFVLGKRYTVVRPVHDFGVRAGWMVVEHTVLEELVHDVTQFGPVVAVQNFIETVIWRWGAFK